jgi:hypothetical protein
MRKGGRKRMKYLVLVLVVFVLAVGVAQAASMTIQRGVNGTVSDGYIRANTATPDGAADANWGGAAGDVRMYPDVNYNPSKSQRHNLVKFDLSGLAGATITSATFGMYYSGNGPTVNDYKISRLNAGKSWVEGVHSGAGVSAGEVTWNSQASGGAAWATAGATGAADIDVSTTMTWSLASGSGEGYRQFDITNWVRDWVSGAWENNGFNMYGGVGDGSTSYWLIGTSESGSTDVRPYLTINYTPAPAPEPGSLMALGTLGVAALGLMRRRRA